MFKVTTFRTSIGTGEGEGGEREGEGGTERERETESWCFKPSQPKRFTSGLKETFIKKYIVEKTNKAEIRPEEQSEKAEGCRENLWNEIQLKGL